MALQNSVKGGLWPSPLFVWEVPGGVAPLTGATLTGWIRNRRTGETREIAGTLTVIDGAAGAIQWDLAEEDVAETGNFDVQLEATFASGPTPGRSHIDRWTVTDSIIPAA